MKKPYLSFLISFFAGGCEADDPSSWPRDPSSEFLISSTKLESWQAQLFIDFPQKVHLKGQSISVCPSDKPHILQVLFLEVLAMMVWISALLDVTIGCAEVFVCKRIFISKPPAKVISARLWLLERLMNGWYCMVCVISRFSHYWIIFSWLWFRNRLYVLSSWTYLTFAAKVEILSATLYNFLRSLIFNVLTKHDDQQILLYITSCRNVPIHIPWMWNVVFGQWHEVPQALSYSDASENNMEQSEWKKLKRNGKHFCITL